MANNEGDHRGKRDRSVLIDIRRLISIAQDSLSQEKRKIRFTKPSLKNHIEQYMEDKNLPSRFVQRSFHGERIDIAKAMLIAEAVKLPPDDYVSFIKETAHGYLNDIGPSAYRGMGDPKGSRDQDLRGTMDLVDLRDVLLNDPEKRKEIEHHSKVVSVEGFLYPCALLSSGWWESEIDLFEEPWKNNTQKWLFTGFNHWGPSWDFTWNLDAPGSVMVADRVSRVAQLGYGDEANSIPVIIPSDKAVTPGQQFKERGVATDLAMNGVWTTVRGLLCHRSNCPDAAHRQAGGGILDYCIWLDPDKKNHAVSSGRGRSAPELYSGYLWKCVAPRNATVEDPKKLNLSEVYFIWEHTNLADESAVKYNLDSLERKEDYIRNQYHGGGQFVLLQKSSVLVPGTPAWSTQEFYEFYQRQHEELKRQED